MRVLRALFSWLVPAMVTEVTGAELLQALKRAGVACHETGAINAGRRLAQHAILSARDRRNALAREARDRLFARD